MYHYLRDFLSTRRQFTVFKSLEEVAAACQIAPAELARYESGEAVPPPAVIPSLARALQVGPRTFARLIKESQAGGIRPASVKNLLRHDRHVTCALARWTLAQKDTTPEERRICRVLLTPRRRHSIQWYLVQPDPN